MSCFDLMQIHPDFRRSIKHYPDEGFQFKELGCNTSIYEIDGKGMLSLKEDHSNGVDAALHLNYSGRMTLVGVNEDYVALFKKGKIMLLQKKADDDYS